MTVPTGSVIDEQLLYDAVADAAARAGLSVSDFTLLDAKPGDRYGVIIQVAILTSTPNSDAQRLKDELRSREGVLSIQASCVPDFCDVDTISAEKANVPATGLSTLLRLSVVALIAAVALVL